MACLSIGFGKFFLPLIFLSGRESLRPLVSLILAFLFVLLLFLVSLCLIRSEALEVMKVFRPLISIFSFREISALLREMHPLSNGRLLSGLSPFLFHL